MPAPIEDIIAKAIKDADKSFFNEDYAKQAKAVTAALKKAGYEVAPLKPPPGLVEWAKDNIPFGRLRPTELITQMYWSRTCGASTSSGTPSATASDCPLSLVLPQDRKAVSFQPLPALRQNRHTSTFGHPPPLTRMLRERNSLRQPIGRDSRPKRARTTQPPRQSSCCAAAGREQRTTQWQTAAVGRSPRTFKSTNSR